MNNSNFYQNTFKSWQTKLLGSKPTEAMLASIHNLNARPGKQALACAMALRPEGVTAGQIQIACGAPQLNKMRGFITDALLKREMVPPTAQGHTVYKLHVTPKGEQRIKRSEAAALKAAEQGKGEAAEKPAKAKATKAKGASKPRKAKAAPAAVEPPADTAPTAPQGDGAVEQPQAGM